MELLRALDGYCERVGPEYWSEPVNAITNAAFVLAAIFMWRRSRAVPLARALAVVLGLIGLGSYLFHTHAQVWAAIADVTPIAVFILLYLVALNRAVWGLGFWSALGATVLFVPYAALTIPLWQPMPLYGTSAGYMPVPTLIFIYAALLWRKEPALARGLVTGAVILLMSLAARGLDMPLCRAFPLGTHFLWHILNGIMLGWMIEVYRRHALEGARAPR